MVADEGRLIVCDATTTAGPRLIAWVLAVEHETKNANIMVLDSSKTVVGRP